MADGFREFRVANKVVESDIITSFYLEPTDGAPVWDVKPGQYLTLCVPGPDQPALKTYSVSGDLSEAQYHRITVKRETGRDGTPDGVGSSWLHDHIDVDATLDVAAPRGTFFLDEASDRPVLLLSGGVGLTPMVSMLHRLSQTDREVHFLHACENGKVHALRDEVLALQNDRIKARFVYRCPSDADRAAKLFDAEGVIDAAFLRKHIPIGDYDVYLCGPTPFMVAMYQMLQELGVPKARISYEFFGKAASLDALAKEVATSKAASRAAPTIQSLTFLTNPDAWASEGETPDLPEAPAPKSESDVAFQQSNVTAQWDGSANSLLELAEDAGLNPEFSCRAGICNSCKCGLVSGEVEYFEDPLIPPEAGQVLICCSRPKGPVTLDL
ncbi:2Fe-2S iron-sulfur cluster-binding protein [Shimia thalassica]|uniref:2Fe-2S iron-sulfur cluster-binding protein n=1 Tax=Shimia thalassica TaxID=1715693 RepID=UPI0026E3116A|nr:2Fe-2S iron-sulfur cluster-binding protein [Shimia thalassica]MDO6479223.1 2Fe-2S iron-sulfur cluster-binding protein [Shimia thalassica]